MPIFMTQRGNPRVTFDKYPALDRQVKKSRRQNDKDVIKEQLQDLEPLPVEDSYDHEWEDLLWEQYYWSKYDNMIFEDEYCPESREVRQSDPDELPLF